MVRLINFFKKINKICRLWSYLFKKNKCGYKWVHICNFMGEVLEGHTEPRRVITFGEGEAFKKWRRGALIFLNLYFIFKFKKNFLCIIYSFIFLILILYCYSITVVCLFSPSLLYFKILY